MEQRLAILVFMIGLLVAKRFAEHSQSPISMALSPAELEEIVSHRTMLHVVGHHRGGTTILWDLLRRHPNISGLGLEGNSAKARFPWIEKVRHEGVFLQDVYPKFSLDHPPSFFLKRLLATQLGSWLPSGPWLEHSRGRLLEGIGSFGLSSSTHLTEDSHLGNQEDAGRLLRQWGALWDLSQPVLLEKSPSNARIVRLLHAMWNTLRPAEPKEGDTKRDTKGDVDEDEDKDTRLGCEVGASAIGSRRCGGTKFVFMTRHPIAQALAMEAFTDDLSVYDLVLHWLAVQESFVQDIRHLPTGAVKVFELETLVTKPVETVRSVCDWLAIDDITASNEWSAWLNLLDEAPNEKYRQQYEQRVNEHMWMKEQHEAIVADLGDRVRNVSQYELTLHSAW